MQEQPTQTIVFEFNGRRYEAPVDPMPVKRSFLTDGHLIVEHSSCSYAIYLDLRPDSERQGEYVAHRIVEGDERTPEEWDEIDALHKSWRDSQEA